MLRMLWTVIGLLCFWTLPLVAHEVAQEAEAARAMELLQELAESGQADNEMVLINLWIQALEKEIGTEHPQVLHALHTAGMVFYEQGQYRESLRYFERAVELSKTTLGSEHPETLTALNNLAQILDALGDRQRALGIQEQVLQASRRILGDEHPDTLTTNANLAGILSALGDLQGSKQREEQVLQIRRRILGEEHPDTLTSRSNLAVTLQAFGDLQGAKRQLEQVLDIRQRILGDEHPDTLTTNANLAVTLKKLGDLQGAKRRIKQVLQIRQRILGDEHPSTLTANTYFAIVLGALGDLQGAKQREEQILQIRQRILGDEHPDTVTANENLALRLQELGDPKGAKRRLEQVLQIRQNNQGEEHPDTLRTNANLATALEAIGDFQGAKQRLEKVQETYQRILGEEHPDTLTVDANLAGTLVELGELQEAKRRLEWVIQIRQRILGEEHPDTVSANGNLANTLFTLGDLQGARQREERVLKIRQRILGEEHPDTVLANANLAGTLEALGDLQGAKQRKEQVLTVRQRILGEEHPDTVSANENLANTLHALGELQEAKRRLERVLAVRQRILGKDHPDTILASGNLAATLYELGDLQGARQRQEQVLKARQLILGDKHPDTLTANANLAGTLLQLGDLREAKLRYEENIAVRRKELGEGYLPSTLEEANEFFFLGATHQELGAPQSAFSIFVTGLDALEAQTLRTDPAEGVKTQYIARYGKAYRSALASGIEARKTHQALHVLERYRTQSLLSLLHWRHPKLGHEVPDHLSQELTRISRRYDWLTRERGRLYPQPAPEVLAEQARLRRRREVIQGESIALRRAQGKLPQPLETEAIQAILEPGTLLLSFSLGDETSHVFALTSTALHVHSLDVQYTKVKIQVERFRTLDHKAVDDLSEGRQKLSHWLYDKLLTPVAQEIQDADRIVILPDGPLNYLHFAALTHSTPDDPRGWQYLAEWKPTHTVQSATVYAELVARRKDNPSQGKENPVQWVGFGNPFYPKDEDVRLSENAPPDDNYQLPEALSSTQQRGVWDELAPLSYTEREVKGIAKFFPKGAAQLFLQKDANEDRARQILSQAPIVHFAAHGVADPDFPMDSFLALSLLEGQDGAQHNGLLQAWEIANDLHLNADLVVLSACVTALGPSRGGEGLISLSRAFQIAGARSVLASLWAVNDLSTSELMIRFYKYLRAGETKDRALQLAQQDFIGGPIEVTLDDGTVVTKDFTAPYYWAAFQLIGDWR